MGEFSVRGKQVVVVGAARSGVAAAELLLARGARVTVTDLRTDVQEAAELRAAGVALELGGHREGTLTRADLVVLSPGVPPRQPVNRGDACRWRAGHRGGRVGLAMVAWSSRCGHWNEG